MENNNLDVFCAFFFAKPGSLHFGMGSQAMGSQAVGFQAMGSQGMGSQAMGSKAIGSQASIIFWIMGSEYSGLPVWRFPNTVVSLYGVFIYFSGASQFEVL